MSNSSRDLAQNLTYVFRWASVTLVAGFAIVLAGATLLAALGQLPWPELVAVYGGVPVPNAGMWAQIGLTAFFLGLCFFIPSAARVLRLEDSHRNFSVTMDDIAQAYQISHNADRNGAFSLSAEFDSIRERMDYLRAHPDLRSLEPGVLEVASQMSFESRDLARIYATDSVDRARLFLKQRQEEIDTFAERLAMAKQTVSEIRRWSQQVEVEEAVQTRQLERLEADLLELLPGLGFDIDDDMQSDPPLILDQRTAEEKELKVVHMSGKPAPSAEPEHPRTPDRAATPAE